MLRLCSTLFALLLAAVVWFIVATTRELPDPVATHFGFGYFANGWMSRAGYLRFMLAFATVLPVVIVAMIGWLPRIFPRGLNIPNRDLWLAPERRGATLDTLATRACILGALLSLFIGGVHQLIREANAAFPPQLPAQHFWMLLIALSVVFATWLGMFWRRFRRAP